VYREVAKRYKLWGIEAQRGHFKNNRFDLFIDFIKRGLDFLAIRETPELFRSINEFYNAILKQEYLIALSHTRQVLANYLANVTYLKGGRVDGLVPSRLPLFKKISGGILSVLIEYSSLRERFGKFRQLSRKFNQTFLLYINTHASSHDTKIAEYSAQQQEETKNDIDAQLIAHLSSLNGQGPKVLAFKCESDLDANFLLSQALCLLESDPDCDNDPFKIGCNEETGAAVFLSKTVSV